MWAQEHGWSGAETSDTAGAHFVVEDQGDRQIIRDMLDTYYETMQDQSKVPQKSTLLSFLVTNRLQAILL
ncbi:MAG TPA: hypothetical protein VGU63_16990, partial [Candidatus Acidoferrales bacterium]|nr:hypothetical protein [Candidatus Acidoferrales bacterium]